jgi:hypothetical protein
MSRNVQEEANSNEYAPLLYRGEKQQAKARSSLIHELQIAVIMALVILFGSGNRVASKV